MIKKVGKFLDVVNGATSMALASDGCDWTEQRQRFDNVDSKYKKLLLLAIHDSVRTCPELIQSMLAMPYKRRGYEVIGSGYCSTVIRMGNYAFKLLRATEGMPENQQANHVKQLETSQATLLEYLEEFTLVQDFDIIEHPLRKQNSVVASKQLFLEEFDPLKMGALLNLNTQQKRDIGRFTDGAREMIDETGLAPDVLGANNLGFTRNNDGSLVIVDTLPIDAYRPSDMPIKYIDRIAASVQTPYPQPK